MKIERCEYCNSIISSRKIALYSGMVQALFLAYKWCLENKTDTFRRRDIKHLFKSENETARFGDWVYFGNFIIKPNKGWYIINFDECEKFFSGKKKVYVSVWKNPLTNEIIKEDLRAVDEIKNIYTFLNKYGDYVAKYR